MGSGASDSWLPLLGRQQMLLFPHSLMPMYIYDREQQSMIRASLKTNPRVAVALLRKDPDLSPLPVYRHVCIGRVIDLQELSKNKWQIVVEGIKRGVITSLNNNGQALVEPLDDFLDLNKKHELNRELKSFQRLAHVLSQLMPKQQETIKSVMYSHPHPGIIADLFAFRFVNTAYDKICLLSEPDILRRLQLISVYVRSLIYQYSPEKYQDLL